jgi:UDP-N-acetyl-D-mannosaminuronic acid dehydrogenase
VLAAGRLEATTDNAVIGQADIVVVVIGTPVDEHLNPDPHAVPRALEAGQHLLRTGQLVVLRSTVYPGVTRRVEKQFADSGVEVDVAFCPERIAEGKAMEELFDLPQIVSARTPVVRERAATLFRHLTDTIVELEPEEAELAKLFTNTWRYIKFAAANQFYVMANDHGLDYDVIRKALAQDDPRASDMPGAGFAAGPCLFKDTMQLAAFTDNSFILGHSAMLVNERLPLYLVSRLEKKYRLENLTVGILGMAFKGESDDIRSSLSYKLKRILQFRAGKVITTDPYVTVDDSLLPLEDVIEQSDVLIVGAPHRQYQNVSASVEVVDVWNLLGKGTNV